MTTDEETLTQHQDLVQKLSYCIKTGNIEDAKNFAALLAEEKVAIDMIVEPEDKSREKVISVKIIIEDRHTVVPTPVEWDLKVSTKVSQLKRMMKKGKSIPLECQRWIISNRVADDNDSLSRCGITSDGYTIFLYLVSLKKRRPDETQDEVKMLNGTGDRVEEVVNREAIAFSMGPVTYHNDGNRTRVLVDSGPRSQPAPNENLPDLVEFWQCSRCTLRNEQSEILCKVCLHSRPDSDEPPLVPQQQDREQSQEEMRLDLTIPERPQESATERNRHGMDIDDDYRGHAPSSAFGPSSAAARQRNNRYKTIYNHATMNYEQRLDDDASD